MIIIAVAMGLNFVLIEISMRLVGQLTVYLKRHGYDYRDESRKFFGGICVSLKNIMLAPTICLMLFALNQSKYALVVIDANVMLGIYLFGAAVVVASIWSFRLYCRLLFKPST